MRRCGGGALVTTSSTGRRRTDPALPAGGAVERALNSTTETAAVTWAPEGRRVDGTTPPASRAAGATRPPQPGCRGQ